MISFIIGRIRSFRPAIQGLIYILKNEKNTWIHFFATVVVIFISVYLQLNKTEWLFILTAIFTVWISELVNTAIEKTIDMITLEKNSQVKIIKDLSAAFVLLAALYAVICGLIIFLPKLLN